MKHLRILILSAIVVSSMSSCVSTKKYNALSDRYKKLEYDKNYGDAYVIRTRAANQKLTLENDSLSGQNASMLSQTGDLKTQLAELKKRNTQALSTVQGLSEISNSQAESIKQTLDAIGQKDSFIQGLRAALSEKDSLNLSLVINLKAATRGISDKDINIKVEKSATYIDISDKMLFGGAKYTISEKSKAPLRKIAEILNAYPDISFTVEGHTDSITTKGQCIDDNWDLSTKRATVLVRLLQNQYKVKPSRMSVAGRGQYLPVQSNSSAEGRESNRRTRIVIVPQLDSFFKLLAKH